MIYNKLVRVRITCNTPSRGEAKRSRRYTITFYDQRVTPSEAARGPSPSLGQVDKSTRDVGGELCGSQE